MISQLVGNIPSGESGSGSSSEPKQGGRRSLDFAGLPPFLQQNPSLPASLCGITTRFPHPSHSHRFWPLRENQTPILAHLPGLVGDGRIADRDSKSGYDLIILTQSPFSNISHSREGCLERRNHRIRKQSQNFKADPAYLRNKSLLFWYPEPQSCRRHGTHLNSNLSYGQFSNVE